MTAAQLFEQFGEIDPKYLETASISKLRKRGYIKWVALAASICLVIGGTLHTMNRMGYFKMGCSASAGTIVDGAYYYNQSHHGLYRYTEAEGSKRIISSYWADDGYLVNENGIYYRRGRSLYLLSPDTGKSKRLYTASSAYTQISFSLQQDGTVLLTQYNQHTKLESVVLLDGTTGALLETVLPDTAYAVAPTQLVTQTRYTVGERVISLAACDGSKTAFDLLENGKSILPQNVQVLGTPNYYGENLYFRCADAADGTYFVVMADGGEQWIELPEHSYCDGFDQYLFYVQDDAVWCIDLETKDCWMVKADAASQFYDLTTDGTYLYSCVPWDSAQSCWKLVYEDGRPVSMQLIDADITQ